VPLVEQDQSGLEGTQLNTQLDSLVTALQQQAAGVLAGNNPSNASVIGALGAVFNTCRPVDSGEKWPTTG
jgi:hypothetical protein